jgi:uncharacterized protein (DUF2384 family)
VGNTSLPEIYEELKDKRRQAASVADVATDLASLARGHGLDALAHLLDAVVQEAESAGKIPAGYKQEGLDHLIRQLEIHALADRVFADPEKAKAWLSRPNASLNGQPPSDLLKDELGAAVVRETLEQIDHGIFA